MSVPVKPNTIVPGNGGFKFAKSSRKHFSIIDILCLVFPNYTVLTVHLCSLAHRLLALSYIYMQMLVRASTRHGTPFSYFWDKKRTHMN